MSKIRSFLIWLFSVREWDNHWVFLILGIQIKLKRKKILPLLELKKRGVTIQKRTVPLVVSLTSFPARINSVSTAIKNLLQQTLLPDHLILWLSPEEFPNGLPATLTDLQTYGLKIGWCPNLGSYKKLLPALKAFPEAIIVTVDDDIYYPLNLLEKLYQTHLTFPNQVIVGRAGRLIKNRHRIKLLTDRQCWTRKFPNSSFFNTPIGYGGCLYPPHSLSPQLIQPFTGLKLLPTHDDLYFWGALVLNRIPVRLTTIDPLCYLPNTQQYGLCKVNQAGKGVAPNEALNILLEAYPEILNFLNSL